MSQASIDLEISHEEVKTIVNEKEKYEQMKERITNIKSSDKLSENSKDFRKNAIYYLMPGTFMINQFLIKSRSMMRLGRFQQYKEMITQQDVC